MHQSPRHECAFRAGCKCAHVAYAGDTTDERCAVCPGYLGKPRGFGDVIHNALAAVGVPQLVERTIGDCGCPERRAAMNRAMPFADKLETEK